MNNKNKQVQNKLTLYMGLLYLFAILFFGLILINDKKKDILLPKIEEKLKNYAEKTYKEDKENFSYNKIKRTGDTYYLKVENKKNKHLYFNVNYENKKITDTYQKDYLEGNTLNKYMEEELNKTLQTKENPYNKYKVVYNTKLTDMTSSVKRKLINKNYNIQVYTIEVETSYKDLTELKEILQNLTLYTTTQNLLPKNYNITLNNKNITKSMNIIIDNDIIINDIDTVVQGVTENNTSLLQKLNIKLKYLN